MIEGKRNVMIIEERMCTKCDRGRERERASERKVYNVAKLDAVVMFRFTHTHTNTL